MKRNRSGEAGGGRVAVLRMFRGGPRGKLPWAEACWRWGSVVLRWGVYFHRPRSPSSAKEELPGGQAPSSRMFGEVPNIHPRVGKWTQRCEGWEGLWRARTLKTRPLNWIRNWAPAQVWTAARRNCCNLRTLNQPEPQINLFFLLSWAPNQGFFKRATPSKSVWTRTKPIHFLEVLNYNNMGILKYLSN